jgi:hypothetical protein
VAQAVGRKVRTGSHPPRQSFSPKRKDDAASAKRHMRLDTLEEKLAFTATVAGSYHREAQRTRQSH